MVSTLRNKILSKITRLSISTKNDNFYFPMADDHDNDDGDWDDFEHDEMKLGFIETIMSTIGFTTQIMVSILMMWMKLIIVTITCMLQMMTKLAVSTMSFI